MNAINNAIRATLEGQAKYDAVCKELLSNRQILSHILKAFVKEYKDCSPLEIETKYIEAESVKLSAVPVERNLTNTEIIGISNEDITVNEGSVYYDIIFKAKYPAKSGKMIGLIINVEAQNDYYPGYKIETRGIYYAARRLSSQFHSLTRQTDYAALEKVYSIWIYMGKNIPKSEAGAATLYEIRKDDIIGYVKREPEDYDLMAVIVVRVGDNHTDSKHALALLQTLFSDSMSADVKLRKLEEFGIQIDDEFKKGVGSMGNLGKGLYDRAYETAYETLYETVYETAYETAYEAAQEKAKRDIAIALYHEGTDINLIAKAAKVTVDTIENWLKEEEAMV